MVHESDSIKRSPLGRSSHCWLSHTIASVSDFLDECAYRFDVGFSRRTYWIPCSGLVCDMRANRKLEFVANRSCLESCLRWSRSCIGLCGRPSPQCHDHMV